MTDILKKKYDEIVSIGFNCFPKKYISTRIANCANKYFDNVGTPCWAILELLKNDFSDLQCIEKIKINEKSNVYTNKKYYVRHLHDNFNMPNKINTMKSIENRAQRFRELLKTNKNVLFIRLEELMTDRIIYDEYVEFYKKSEDDYLIEISNWLKNNTALNFKFIYLNSNKKYYDDIHKILYIQDNVEKYEWSKCSGTINDIINKHTDDIIKYL
jgi:hypothetical protein